MNERKYVKAKVVKDIGPYKSITGNFESREILELLQSEKIGMLPPFSKQRDFGCECGCKGWCAKGHDWDYEHLPNGSNQTWRTGR